MSVEEGWHGWSNESVAVFLRPLQGSPEDDEPVIGLFIQRDRSVDMLAGFTSYLAAEIYMDWMDQVIEIQANANSVLTRRLQTEQPLLFSPSIGDPSGAE